MPVEMVQCKTINEKAIAHAEIVIEGELLPNVRVREDQNTNTGRAMPEFPGYTGEAKEAIPVIKVKAVTHRINPIWRTTVGPGEEHVNMAGYPDRSQYSRHGRTRHAGQITQRLRPLGGRRQAARGAAIQENHLQPMKAASARLHCWRSPPSRNSNTLFW